MKTIIAGSRTYNDKVCIHNILDALKHTITEVVCGEARGVDTIGKQWAILNEIPIHKFHADWLTHGISAGPIRNEQMAQYAESCIVFWNGKSRGTEDMIKRARRYKLNLVIVPI